MLWNWSSGSELYILQHSSQAFEGQNIEERERVGHSSILVSVIASSFYIWKLWRVFIELMLANWACIKFSLNCKKTLFISMKLCLYYTVCSENACAILWRHPISTILDKCFFNLSEKDLNKNGSLIWRESSNRHTLKFLLFSLFMLSNGREEIDTLHRCVKNLQSNETDHRCHLYYCDIQKINVDFNCILYFYFVSGIEYFKHIFKAILVNT